MEKGLELMLAGMGGVFTFLALMVAIMYVTSLIFKKYEKPAVLSQGNAGQDDQLAQVAVAIAAVKRHTQG